MDYGDGLWEASWRVFVIPDHTRAGLNRWARCKVVRALPCLTPSRGYVSIEFRKDPYGKNENDRLSVDGNSKGLVREFWRLRVGLVFPRVSSSR